MVIQVPVRFRSVCGTLRINVKKGDNLIFTAFGAGFTWGADLREVGIRRKERVTV